MRKFFVHASWLFVLPITLLVVSESIEIFIWNSILKDHQNSICLGDSHARPIQMANGPTIARNGDTFLIPLLSLKRIIGQHEGQLRSVFLAIGPHSFSQLSEDKLLLDHNNWMSANGRRISNRLSPFEFLQYRNHAIPILSQFKYEFSVFDKATQSDPAIWKRDTMLYNGPKVASRHRLTEVNWFKESGTQIELLNELITECEKNDIMLFLVETPLHHTYLSHIEKSSWQKYCNYLNGLQKNHPKLFVLSFDVEDWPDSLFSDSDHLNPRGGEIISELLEQAENALQLP